MSCNKQIKQNCGTIIYGACVRYEKGVSNNSSLTEGCISIEETTEDIYNQLDSIDEKITLSSIVNDCITFTEPKTINSVIGQLYNKLCELEGIIITQAGLIETLQGQVEDLQQNNCG